MPAVVTILGFMETYLSTSYRTKP